MTFRTVSPILCAMSLLIFGGCKPGTTRQQGDYPEFNPLETTQIVTEFDDYIDEIELVHLTTPDSLPVYGVKKLLVTDDRRKDIVAVIGREVFKFDRDGNLLFRIGRLGRGPGEYSAAYDACFNDEQTEVWMLCQLNEVMKYDLATGRYLATVKAEHPLPYHAMSISPAANGGFFLYVPTPMSLDITTTEEAFFCLRQYDAAGKLIAESMPPTDFSMNFALPYITKSYDNTYLVAPQENENIGYEIKDGIVSELCKIHFGSENIDPLWIYNRGGRLGQNVGELILSDYYKYPMLLHKTRRHLFFTVMGPGGGRNDSFVVEVDDFKGIHWHGIPNPTPSNQPFYIMGADETHLYGVFNYFGEYTDEQIDKFDPLVRYLMRKHNIRLDESANPAIVKIKISNF